VDKIKNMDKSHMKNYKKTEIFPLAESVHIGGSQA
jgi:hypothetical protein